MGLFDKLIKTEHEWKNIAGEAFHYGDYEKALCTLSKAIKINSKRPDLFTSKGNTLKCLRRYSEALDAFGQAIEIEPEYALAWKGRGEVLSKMGRQSDATKSFYQAFKIDGPNAIFSADIDPESYPSYAEAMEILKSEKR